MAGIKQCPWHDEAHNVNTNIIIYDDADMESNPFYWAECGYCGARGPLSDTRDSAVEEWNKAERKE